MLVRTYVAPSGIEGLGVFAADDIPANTLLWELDDKFTVTFTLEELEALPDYKREFVERYSFPHIYRPGHLIVELDDGRFMNHAETPNTDFKVFDKGYAIRDIKAGEEITCNYFEFDPSFAGKFKPKHETERKHSAG
jgi:hypothetical protein